MDDNKASFVDRGAPVGKTKRVDAKGTKDAKNDVCGYSIVQAESADAGCEDVRQGSAAFLQMPGASIEVIEIIGDAGNVGVDSWTEPDGAADAAPFFAWMK